MDKEKKTLAAVGVLGALAAVLFLRKKAEAAPQMDAAITIRVLDSAGNEVPHNSPVELGPGAYTIAVDVTNLSVQAGSYVDATLTTAIEAAANGTDLIAPTSRVDDYGPGATMALTWPLIVPDDLPISSGSIIARVFSPAEWKLAQASQAITTTGPRRAAVNGMGDLDDDGYVSEADVEILRLYIFGYPVSDISPLSEAEFVRRADMNGDGNINAGDITAMRNFIYTGEMPVHYHADLDMNVS